MIQMNDVSYSYTDYQNVLEHVNLIFEQGKLYAILGASGCGKTTMLSLLGGLTAPKCGKILYDQVDIAEFGLDKHRQKHAAFIFQGYNLIEYMTAKENVELTAKLPVEEALKKVGLEQELWKRNVLKLSGGQQQRVAIARALASNKPVLLADEPTGNLDEDTARQILELLKKSAHEEGRCVIMVTHAAALAAEADELKELREQFYACLTIEQTGSEEDTVTPQMARDAAEAVQPDGWSGTNVFYLSMEDISLILGRYTKLADAAMHTARLVACRESRLAREFTMETLELSEGRTLEPEDNGKVIISDTLAELNGLKIGDRICGAVTEDVVIGAKAGIGTEYGFDIVGIFHVKEEEKNSSLDRAECEMLSNYLFVDEATGFRFMEEIWQCPRYYNNGIALWMKDPARLESAVETVKTLAGYRWEKYFINTNGAEYERSAEPIKKMGAIVNILMAVIFGIGGIFLAVILVLWNRECQQEMGILLSLGCGKKNILFQLILENSSLFLVSYLVAVPAMEAGKQVINGWLSAGAADLQWMQICTVGIAGWLGCVLVTGLAAVTVMRKSPTELLSAVV